VFPCLRSMGCPVTGGMGERVSPGTISNLNKEIYGCIKGPIKREHPYVLLDGTWLKMRWGDEIQGVCILVAIGANAKGREELEHLPSSPQGAGFEGRHKNIAYNTYTLLKYIKFSYQHEFQL